MSRHYPRQIPSRSHEPEERGEVQAELGSVPDFAYERAAIGFFSHWCDQSLLSASEK